MLSLRCIGYLICILIGLPAEILLSQDQATDDAILAWSQREYQSYNVFFSLRNQQQWSSPKRLSDSTNNEILPTLTSDMKENIWVIWIELEQSGEKLMFRHYSNYEWSKPKTIETGNKADMAPSVIVDINDDVWLAWSGTDKNDDDIFVARWLDGAWTNPQKVNTDDSWPDILPQLSLTDNGMPTVTWKGFDGNIYKHFSSYWTGTLWSPESVSEDSVEKLSSLESSEKFGKMPQFQGFVENIDQATIHLQSQGKRKTVPLKSP